MNTVMYDVKFNIKEFVNIITFHSSLFIMFYIKYIFPLHFPVLLIHYCHVFVPVA